jgi:eukaryotic-like serine/threonine-protein kinase
MSNLSSVESIFFAALQKGSAEERAAYLDEACAGDEDLRRRVDRLLDAHPKVGDFMEKPAVAAVTQPSAEEAAQEPVTLPPRPIAEGPGSRIGPYKLLQQIGEGGMGVVYMAEQEKPVHRRVALKIIKPGMDSGAVVARFEAERQALAMMDHVNIARVLDAGTTGGVSPGRPYFVMELVPGVSLTRYCDENKLSPRERLELLIPICQAIQHAHQKGIIHRDIKPSNVLVTLYDGKPVPKVIDFGVAKAIDQRLTERTMFTQFGAVIGTLEYMSPEQAEMSGLGVDTRSDIYSLGVLLYELLTGTTPLERKQVRELAYAELLRMIKEDEPPKPSTRLTRSGEALATISAQRRTEPAQLAKLVRGELDWIVMKCLEKDRTRRYETASGLARDLQRYLDDEPVEACPPSTAYRLRKFARKYRRALRVATAFALLLVVATAVSFWQAVRATNAERQARDERDRAVAEQARADAEAVEAATQQQRAEANAERLRVEKEVSDRRLYVADMRLAQRAWDDSDMGRLHELLEGQRPERTGGIDPRGFEWDYWWRQSHRELLALKGHAAGIRSVVFSPDGRRLATGSDDHTVKVWDATTGKETLTLEGHGGFVASVAFSPDGRRLASGNENNAVKLWDAATGQQTLTLKGHAFAVNSVAFRPDGRRLASGSDDTTVKVWDAATGQEMLTLKGHTRPVRSVAFSPDGKRLASASDDDTVKVWDAATGRETLTLKGHTSWVWSVAFSPDARRLASGGWDRTVKIWDLATGKESQTLKHAVAVTSVSFSPDGRRLASGSRDHTVKVWDAATAQETLVLKGHSDRVLSVSFSADGRRLASASQDNLVKVWDAATMQEPLTLKGHTVGVTSVSFSPDGRRLASGSYDGTVKIWDVATGQEKLTFNGHTMPVAGVRIPRAVYSVSFNPDGKRVTSGSYDNTVKIWDSASGQETITLRERGLLALFGFPPPGVWTIALGPDGRHVASARIVPLSGTDPDNGIKVWDAATGKMIWTLTGHEGQIRSLRFSPDGRRLASGSQDTTVKIWDVATGHETLTLKGHAGAVTSVAFSPDGRHLATGSQDKTVKVWDTATGQSTGTLKGHIRVVNSVAFSSDGRRLAGGSDDNTVEIWDVATGQETLTLRGHAGVVTSVVFSADGRRLVSGNSDGTIKIWDATAPETVSPPGRSQ